MSGGWMGDVGDYLATPQGQGLLFGVSRLGAGLGEAGAAGLQNKGIGTGIAKAFGDAVPAMMQGQSAAYSLAGQQGDYQRQKNWTGAFGSDAGSDDSTAAPGLSPQAQALRASVPKSMWPLMAQLDPRQGGQMLAQMGISLLDPTRGIKDVAPGHSLVDILQGGKTIAQGPWSPKETMFGVSPGETLVDASGNQVAKGDLLPNQRFIPTEAGTVVVGNDGKLSLAFPKPDEIKGVGDFAVRSSPSTGQTNFVMPPGRGTPPDALDLTEGTGKNPNSSASGIGQFTDDTKIEFLQKYGPQVAELTKNQSLAQISGGLSGPISDAKRQQAIGYWNMHPEVAQIMTPLYKAHTDQIAANSLPDQEVTPADRKAAYMLRGEAPNFLQLARQAPDTPVNRILSQRTVSSNPSIFGNSDGSIATVGQAYGRMGALMDNAQKKLLARGNPWRTSAPDLVPVQTATGDAMLIPKENAAGQLEPGKGGQNITVTGGANPSATVSSGGTSGAGAMREATGGLPLGGGPVQVGGKVGDELKSQINDKVSQLQQLQATAAKFKPEFLKSGSQLGYSSTAMADRYLPEGALDKVAPGARKSLAEFTEFKQSNAQSTVKVMHDLFGSALTQHEQKSAGPLLPSLNDSPTEYAVKLKQGLNVATSAILRDNWLLSQGQKLSDKTRSDINVTDMPKFVLQQAKTYEDGLKSQGLAPELATQRTKEWMKDTFGIIPPKTYFQGAQ